MPHGHHIYAKAYDIVLGTMCTYPQSDHSLPHWKCVLRGYAKRPCINLPYQEIDRNYEETIPSIRFHIYHIIGRCTARGRILLERQKTYVTFLNRNLHQINLQKYTLEKS